MTYTYKTTPFAHQREVFEASRDLEIYALWWEMGVGKTKTIIDTAAWLAQRGKIDAVLVVAPNGVHSNWIQEEIPRHWPDDTLSWTFEYHAKKAGTITHQAGAKLIMGAECVAVVAMTYDAIMTERGDKFVRRFLGERRVLLVLDESARIKNPGAKRTKRLIALARRARYKRILTGTPITNSPFDLFSQVRFLDENYWKSRGIRNFSIFKANYGIWIQQEMAGGRRFPMLVAHRNLEELHEHLHAVGSRLTKDETLDLPPKLYSTHRFTLSTEQSDLYGALCSDFIAEIEGDTITAPLAIVRLMKLQQITCGFVKADGETHWLANPRIEALRNILEDIPNQTIIWARFQNDIDVIRKLLGSDCVWADGRVTGPPRFEAVQAFQRGDAKFFVGNPAATGEGVTLTAARTVIYYSNSYKLGDRLQSEDRAHRIGQEHPVQYIDLIAQNTVDERIVQALKAKKDIASIITGDKLKEWLT